MALPTVPDIDDRRTCAQCLNGSRPGVCQAVRSGAIVAGRTYEPDRKQLRRCEGYRPDRSDPDQRPGLQRWPGLKFINIKEKK